ncbi:hypothetical protein BCV70DRAFT_201757 [Testicularia cyperi]|uniref:LIM zinc-binding domain-containing protein n=1 Tax=Testicularia cyperi TaxID=1882483 RepID=A0A317XJE2_9BASI|nr:hypothetical protein BCV70DRAFT_201757 [Testicularia cyperi]
MPRFAVPSAPKCARCEKSVYLAEQVIGPASKPYHRTCLTCVVCNKRLDSTLLVEHDAEPYCKNCHKEHLGTGKGGFAKAVTLNPTSPKSPRSPPGNLPSTTRSPLSTPSRAGAALQQHTQQQYSTPETVLTRAGGRSPSPTKFDARDTPSSVASAGDDSVPAINIRARATGATSPLASPPSPTKYTARSPLAERSSYSPNPQTPIRSIDEAIASGSADIQDPVARLQAAVGGMSLDTPPSSAPRPSQSTVTGQIIPSVDYYDTPSPPSFASTSSNRPTYSTETTIGEDGTPITINTRRVAASDTIGTIRLGNTGSPGPRGNGTSQVNTQSPLSAIGRLPEPRRPDPRTLTGASGTAKIAPPRTSPNLSSAPSSLARDASDDTITGTTSSTAASKRRSGIDRIGLGSSIVDASGGTPLCARCVRPVYFAEQKAAAGRKWHRACLRCDACSTTLESGKLEEGPAQLDKHPAAPQSGANVWCRICYAKYFGPKNLAVGLSLPETMH